MPKHKRTATKMGHPGDFLKLVLENQTNVVVRIAPLRLLSVSLEIIKTETNSFVYVKSLIKIIKQNGNITNLSVS